MWHIYTMEYYSAIKKKEILSFAATWMVFQVVILSEISQRKTNTVESHLSRKSKKKPTKLIHTENGLLVTGVRRGLRSACRGSKRINFQL